MPVIVIHGNGLTGILNKIHQIKKDYDPLSIQEINGKIVGWNEVLMALSTADLFASKRLVILENFDPAATSAQSLDLLKLPQDPDLTIVAKFSKSLTASSKILKDALSLKAQIIPISEAEETNIFPFLDKLTEKNPAAMGELDKLLNEFGGQYLLTMIFYAFRRLILPSKKLPSFVLQKIAKQRNNFGEEKIAEFYKAALETDFKIKKGLTDEKMGLTLLVNNILSS